MPEFKTKIASYCDDEGHHHFDFVIDKEHMALIKTGKFTPEENAAWERIRNAPDDFFKKAYGLMFMLNMLHDATNGKNDADA